MKEIKLRAWDKERLKMIYKFDSNFDDNPTGYVLLQTEYGKIFCGNYLDNGDWNEPELIQSAELKDESGKDIYNGCIVTNGVTAYEVVFLNGSFRLKYKTIYRDIYPENEYLEIIGNIYENPYLLK